MIRGCKICAFVAVTMASVVAQSDKSFQVYGFMDGRITKPLLKLESSSFKSYGLTNDVTVTLDHLNLYFDMNPNSRTRALVEFGFQQKPANIDIGAVGRRLTIGTSQMTLRDTVLIVSRKSAANSVVNLNGTDLELKEWGSVSVERAFMEYRQNQYVNLRFGKFITPAGIWNVDHGSPAILTIHQPYQTGFIPIFPKSQIGLCERGDLLLSNAEVAYEFYLSTGRDQVTIRSPKDVAAGGHATVGLPVLGGLSLGLSGYTGMQKTSLTNQNISVNVQDTLAGFAFASMTELGIMNPYDPAVQGAVMQKFMAWLKTPSFQGLLIDPDNSEYEETEIIKSRDNVVGADLRLNVMDFALQSEVNYQWIENQLTGSDATTFLGYYFLLSRSFRPVKNLSVTPYAMFERVVAENSDNNAQFYLSGANFSREESIVKGFQAYSAGLNFKVMANLTLKMEYCYGDVLTCNLAEDYPDLMDIQLLNAQFSIAF